MPSCKRDKEQNEATISTYKDKNTLTIESNDRIHRNGYIFNSKSASTFQSAGLATAEYQHSDSIISSCRKVTRTKQKSETRTMATSALFFISTSAFGSEFEFAGTFIHNSSLAAMSLCNKEVETEQDARLDSSDEHSRTFNSITYLRLCHGFILDFENGSADAYAATRSTASLASSASASRAVTTTIRIATVSASKGTATKDALELIITNENEVNYMLFALVSVFCVVRRSGHQSSSSCDRQRTDPPFSATYPDTQRFYLSCVSFYRMYNVGTISYFRPQIQASINESCRQYPFRGSSDRTQATIYQAYYYNANLVLTV